VRLRDRARNRWQDEVRDDGRSVSGKRWKEMVYKRGKKEAPENSKELSHSGHSNGRNKRRTFKTVAVGSVQKSPQYGQP